MARIRIIKVRGNFDENRPKVMYFNDDNFDRYTTQRYGKYNVAVYSRAQKSKYLNNQIRAYSDKIRFH